jgi:flagellar biosynthesis/type III secretory pathway protein FliH
MSEIRPAQIIRAADVATHTVQSSELLASRAAESTRVIPAVRVRALEEAERILETARDQAEAILKDAELEASKVHLKRVEQARAQASAELASEILLARTEKEKLQEASLDRIVDLSLLVAERVIGETITHDPARVRGLVLEALNATHGAQQIRIEANADDLAEIAKLVETLQPLRVQIEGSAVLARGSLVLHTNLGTIDARLTTQLELLRATLRGIVRG